MSKTIITIISTDGKDGINRETIPVTKDNDKAVKARGNNFREWLKATTHPEVKRTNPKWKL